MVIAKRNLEVLVLLRDDLNELMKSGDLDSECIQALLKVRVAQQRKIQNIKHKVKRQTTSLVLTSTCIRPGVDYKVQ